MTNLVSRVSWAALLLGVACGTGATPPIASTHQAVIGGSGALAPLPNTTSTVNTYYLALAADAPAGSGQLTVSNVTPASTYGSFANVAVGDLVLIYQAQGATISTKDDATYGSVQALNGAGNYELATVTAVAASTSGGVITLDGSCGGLKQSYSAAGKTQVVFVPQYTSVTLGASDTVTAPAWNGSVGGIVAMDATGVVTVNGTISANGIGFRGGAVDNNDVTVVLNTADYVFPSPSPMDGGEKGEGIAGYEAGLGAAGFYGRGAPANGGGGGNNHNAGGGGGANAGDITKWNGTGVMNTTVTGATAAWALDPDDIANGGPTTSSGGGRGGYTYSANQANPLVDGPGNTAWGGDDRYDHGGLGGRPLAPSGSSTVYFGGGGGAGDANSGAGGAGGAGGGIVFLFTTSSGSVTGTGTISANGAIGGATRGAGNDGPGGAGGGGSIVIDSPSIKNVNVVANGGVGGLQTIMGNEAEGPGGGGGGGYIALFTGATPGSTSVVGGAGGTTNSGGVTQFPDNGSTDGNTGIVTTGALTTQLCQPTIAVSMTNSTPAVPGGTITYTVTVTNDGTSTLTNAPVVGTFPATLSNINWGCAPSLVPLSVCNALAGTGGLNTTASIPSGGTVTYTVTGTIAPTATGTLTSSVTAQAASGTPSSTASDTVTLTPESDVSTTITASPEPDALNDNLTYSIKVTNAGPSAATNPTLTITLDPNETFVSAAGGGWTCTGTTTLSCTQASLAVGNTTLTLTVTPTAVGTVSLTAAAAATGDPNLTNNSATHNTTIVRCLSNADCPTPATCTPVVDTCALAAPTITAPTNLSSTSNTEPPISGTCAAGEAVFVSIDGGAAQAATVTGTTWTFTPTTPLTVAEHSVTATATAGSGSATVTSAPSAVAFFVVACTTSSNCTTATAPICSALDTCVACNGDAGSGAAAACPVANPYCEASGACGKCTGAASCAGHAGAICNSTSGACGNGCSVDADCNDTTKWCDAGVCTPKSPNGSPVPTPAPIDGVCTVGNGARVCLSGVCDTTNNECGLTNGKTCAPPSSPSPNAKCDSNICFTDNECGEPNGQACASATVCRSGICFTDGECGDPNGQPCNANDACRTVCVGADDTCGLLNGTPCTTASQCRSNECNADGHCGDPDGTGCTSAVTCRSGVCSLGTCGTKCTLDTDCAAGDYCNSGACVPDLPNSSPCARPTMCASGDCNVDGKCGDPNGTPCLTAKTCRTNACVLSLCGGTCTSDAQCAAGDYCNAGSCVPTLTNSTPCTRATQCTSGVCNADGKCGTPTGQPCTSATVCRSAICDATYTCAAACANDTDCGAGAYCDGTSHLCLPTLGNSAPCTRAAECTSELCDSDGLCGAPNGEPCGSSLLCRSNSCSSSGVCNGPLANNDLGTNDGGMIVDAGAGDGGLLDGGVLDEAPPPEDLAPPDMHVGGDMARDMSVNVKQLGFSGGGFCALGRGPSESSSLPLLLLLAMVTVVVRRARRSRQ